MSPMPNTQLLPYGLRLRADRDPLPSVVGGMTMAVMQDLALATPPGDIVEVGVYRGGTARALEWAVAQRPGCTLWLYDTFGPGIPHANPDKGDAHKVGDFAGGLTPEQARRAFPEARVYAGVFPDDFLLPAEGLPTKVAFAHLDCDQYRSVRDSLAALFHRMVPGGLILLDDYCLAGCERAVHEVGRPFEVLSDGRALFRC